MTRRCEVSLFASEAPRTGIKGQVYPCTAAGRRRAVAEARRLSRRYPGGDVRVDQATRSPAAIFASRLIAICERGRCVVGASNIRRRLGRYGTR